ncbi:UDP-glucose/GDP-mannose dehydrogenase family protein [Arthrobacter sp. zg-Y40]|uniref:UDP-glucose dehydrogenase family protein n=1 Tax=unclassified Arthrobacter TaxID=235627 RepID=UPI001D13AD51|nr:MULTISPECIES: UDP-glucose/GDP-mannose dehydrogenase family protein [unclassified Arthrobacter]MCC3280185.1 UDP-glucose/GDP-mannose dehydrogenase family protein [Arthrobacter sp. zg-Y40]MCC3277244.1 UDP-glucose/GDP-mannose dehydrogenase family protein [Arthrobacter sp. zg-Y20]MDK1317404.1 UDP-glucose/GDP-mannose dehydrogenase family protein [Arthrobacter sp. zg.Y20]MDK1328462.1 UDP-glucose/GDP-mannose dehydrogenase family protein [Arthrobacter sp. zg-Y1143]WIB07177.1 UDP-glucose/GDP-mannose 
MRLSVIGCGYLGAVHAASMAKLGHEVIGIDVDQSRVDELSAARAPFFEPGLPELLAEAEATGRLKFSTDMADAAGADVHFICVGTPQRKGEYAADLRYVDAAVAGLAPYLKPGNAVVGKSTVPVGTAARLAEQLEEDAPGAVLVWNPEFLREGHAVQDTLSPDRFVYGVPAGPAGEAAAAALDEVYAVPLATGTARLVVDYATAELVKTAANSFLATKISFINAMAEVCEASGADVTALADAIGMDERIGRKFLNAGVGFGGGCLPKDIRAFMARAGELGADQALTFLREVDAINMRRRSKVVEMTRDICGGSLLGKRVTILGAAFKPDSDDVRDSPALSAAAQLQLQGATVTVTDPQALQNAKGRFPELNYEPVTENAMQNAHALVLLTEWKEYRSLDPVATAAMVAEKNIIDGRNVLDSGRWRAAGWNYRGMGRP